MMKFQDVTKNNVIKRLLELVDEIYNVDMAQTSLEVDIEISAFPVKDAQEVLEIAKLNARLSGTIKGENDRERKLYAEQAIAQSEEVKIAKQCLDEAKIELVGKRGHRRSKIAYLHKLRLEFEALQSIAALQARQMQLDAALGKTSKTSKNNKTNEVTK